MKRTIHFRYLNQQLNIGIVDVKQVYLLRPEPELLKIEVFRGLLVYRARGPSHRISYRQLKQGLVNKRFSVEEEVNGWRSAPET